MTPRVPDRSLGRKSRHCLRLTASFTPSLQPPQPPITPCVPLKWAGSDLRDQIWSQWGKKQKMTGERDRWIPAKATRSSLSPAHCSTGIKILNNLCMSHIWVRSWFTLDINPCWPFLQGSPGGTAASTSAGDKSQSNQTGLCMGSRRPKPTKISQDT